MIIKEAHAYRGDGDSVTYSLIDNIEKVDVGCDNNQMVPRNYVNIYLKNRKDPKEFTTVWIDETVIYITNDQGKTLQVIKPYLENQKLD